MAYLTLTAPNLKLLKDQVRDAYKIPSSHLSEAIAAALGFGSHAALNAHLKGLTGQFVSLPLFDSLFEERLRTLGSPIQDWRGFDKFTSTAVMSDEEPGVRFTHGSAFRMVYNFWLAPNFERVLAGKAQRPYVNHDHVDFEYLRSVIADEFRFGSPVEIRLANDTIDQVTAHVREATRDLDLMKCHDFAELLLGEARSQSTSIIDVRSGWKPLHQLKERRHAPPPVLLPIVVESSDAENGILWSQQARMRLNVRAANPEFLFNPSHKQSGDDQQGYLTDRLQKALAKCFNTPYLPYCLLDWATSDPLPAEYQGPGEFR
ncbi:hypothetical protein [Pseudomonas violetae]|uniref:Uncharacterized protein n=1 Tax=Pseudomonas violetae TaxID=2915813 RepID=A0ABT0ESD8_9PSED|nr:hypothetical protein [Pseudomonas violetae]MCK1788643.1 hypothetical protein [Pseudomonas violetae]